MYKSKHRTDSSPDNRKKRKKERDRSEERASKKSHRKRYSDSSSSDSDYSKKSKKKKTRRRESDSPPSMVKQKVVDIEELKERRRKEKELIKAYETPEEKRARRLAKKQLKEIKRKQNMGWDNETLKYSNEDNPFGDHNLMQPFIWKMKLKEEGKSLDEGDIVKMNKEKMDESRRELAKVKKRQQEREREKEAREAEREREQRDKESEYYNAWEKQEDRFHLDQAKERSRIRIEDGRAKPIDLLAKYINAEDDDMSVEMHEPYTYLEGLSVSDLEDLLADIQVYLQLEKGKNQDYWRDITTIAEDQLSQALRSNPSAHEVRDRRDGMNESVIYEVNTLFKGKTLNQLNILQDQVRSKLKGGEGVDVGYWEALLQQLKAHIAYTRLKERHQSILKQRLAKLRQEQALESVKEETTHIKQEPQEFKTPQVPVKPEVPESKPSTSTQQSSKSTVTSSELPSSAAEEEEEEEEADIEDEYDSGRCSPKLLQQSEVEEGTIIYNPNDDTKRLELQRMSLKKTGKVQSDADSALMKRAQEGMGHEEARFSVEYNLEQQTFVWSDKYRPRKPRFFNRVHTGYEWNKYNQTHYDMDNPPPKIVQGYKFNIFYPDLIDKTKTPEYSVTPIDGDPDFAVLRFQAGPPYEDIAFKVVNREWEYSYKHGFKCQFHNDIFQLWFHFRRYRYRR